jgi:hypothetical protein
MNWLKGRKVTLYKDMGGSDSMVQTNEIAATNAVLDFVLANTEDWLIASCLGNINVVHPAMNKCFVRRNW